MTDELTGLIPVWGAVEYMPNKPGTYFGRLLMTTVRVIWWWFCDYGLWLRDDGSLVLICRLIVMRMEEKAKGMCGWLNCDASH